MVAIHPFSGLRYNLQKIPDLSSVIAPPYDVIDAEQQEQLYQRSPNNVIRLILGKQNPADTDQDNRYTRTRRDYDSWRQAEVLKADSDPAIYVIRHSFLSNGKKAVRIGFIAALSLDDSTRQQVFRHELTLSAPKADRTKLMEAVPANLEPIFCVYPDDKGLIQSHLEQLTHNTPPTAQATINEEQVDMWVVTQPALVGPIVHHLAGVSVLIADGHHRFEVGFANRARYNTLMTYFASIKDPALVIHPIHRIVTLPASAGFGALEQVCEIDASRQESEAFSWLKSQEKPGRFVLFDGKRWVCVSLRSEAMARWLMAPAVPLVLASFDVSILHGLLLPLLGIQAQSGQAGADGTGIQYAADPAKAVSLVKAAPNRSGWFLRGIPLEQVYAVSAQGVTLSQKSTYFYPKVPSGLVINSFV